MSASVATPDRPASAAPPTPVTRRRKLRTPLAAYGEPMLWLTGGSLLICLIMVIGLVVLVLRMGLGTFWPSPLELVRTADGGVFLGEVTRDERYRPSVATLELMPADAAARARTEMEAGDGQIGRRLFRTGNFDLTKRHFHWVDDAAIEQQAFPADALVLERVEWGRFYGTPTRFSIDGAAVADTPAAAWEAFREHHEGTRDRRRQIMRLDKHELGRLRTDREAARLAVRDVEIEHDLEAAWTRADRDLFDAERSSGDDASERLAAARRRLERLERNLGRPPDEAIRDVRAALEAYAAVVAKVDDKNASVIADIQTLQAENIRYELVMTTADGREKVIALDQITRAYAPNQLGLGGKLGVYLSRWWEFLADEPREANSAGGVFPAIIGTVLMTIIMALLVVPFGVMAALYLREYAKGGVVVSAVRIAINNLAGVPSIVFGVFGLGFFCYGVGGFIDGGPTWALPSPRWFTVLFVTVFIAAGAFAVMMFSLTKPGHRVTRLKRVARAVATLLWIVTTAGALLLIATTPFFDGFFRAGLPNPTFGKGGLIWASFTLALLTLPVVIVATEEALAAVPNSMREGSYACGASKWQTIKRIVLPRAMPGIMTGAILAMARGAGEVAPLMLVGAVKFVGELPVSASPAEHFGVNRSFMHLGFHIYDLGFQSQNSEAAKPMVFTTTLLLITIIAVLNLAAVFLRSRLRRRFAGAQF